MTFGEARAEALRWVAAKLEAQIDAEQQDWIRVLTSAGYRSRITTLSETATMCRMAAARAERGKPL